MIEKQKKAIPYVDNKTFYDEICKYKEEQKINPDVQMYSVLADAILLIGTRLLNHRFFKGKF